MSGTPISRAVILTLSTAGGATYGRILAARQDSAAVALNQLTNAEEIMLTDLLTKALAGMVSGPIPAARCCRFCEVDHCTDCPVTTG